MSGEKEHELYRRRKARNVLTLLLLLALAGLLFTVTIVKLGGEATSPFTENFDQKLQSEER